MEYNGIFQKTEAGRAEIEARQLGLTQQERRVLILVNGKNDSTALARLSLCENSIDLLQSLVEKGLAEPIASPVPDAKAAVQGDTGIPSEPEIGARDFLCNTLQTLANRVRVKALVTEIRMVEDIDSLKGLVQSWYQAISDSPAGMYEADKLRDQLRQLIAYEEANGLR
jgi:hypothetical protein